MPSRWSCVAACALLPTLLLGVAGPASASQSMMRPGGVPKPMVPGSEMDPAACGDLAITLEPATDFHSMGCSRGPATHGGGTGWATKSEIAAAGPESRFFVYLYVAGVSSFFERKDPQSLFEYVLDYDVPGSWSAAGVFEGYPASRFIAEIDGMRASCFAFTRHGGHVARSMGYRNRVAGIYCEIKDSARPLEDARISEMIGRIKTSVF